MKLYKTSAICLVLFLAATGYGFAQQTQTGPSQAEMEAMMKMMSPGENHKHLSRTAGDWDYTLKMWMAPGQPPTDSMGTMHAEMILGGRYVQSVWKGEFMGMPFEGHGTDGYDNASKLYVSSWVDNMGTGIMYSTGTCTADGNSCTSAGSSMDPMTGQKMEIRSVSTWLDEKTFKTEMFSKDPSGSEMKTMEIVGKRK